MAFEVASTKPGKPGAGPSANFQMDDGDAWRVIPLEQPARFISAPMSRAHTTSARSISAKLRCALPVSVTMTTNHLMLTKG